MENKGEIVIYKADSGPELRIKLENETLWLSLQQMADLFERDKSVVSRHIKNVFREGELKMGPTVAVFATVQKEGNRTVEREVEFYNLDVIISVGYRVNSKRGTQFRIWATGRLRDYLLKGYAINERRLRENQSAKLKELQQAHWLIQQALETKRLDGYEKELLNIISDYTNTWAVLNEYDTGRLRISDVSTRRASYLDYDKVKDAVARFKQRLIAQGQASELFGVETGNKLAQLLGSVRQSFDGLDVYPSPEEKAAYLFYFAVKDHPFVDGNKRIGSLMFVLFMIENHLLMNRKGERRLNDMALAALALLIAESKPAQKDVMVKLIVNLINKK